MSHTILGVDPDLTRPAFAWVDVDSGKVEEVMCVNVKGKFKNSNDKIIAAIAAIRIPIRRSVSIHVCCVEGQQISYTARTGANPVDVLSLGIMAGAIAGMVHQEHNCKLLLPRPVDWKGQVPKDIHQTRIYSRLGWESQKKSGYAIPLALPYPVVGADELNSSDWKHIGDAIGLACWAREQFLQGAW